MWRQCTNPLVKGMHRPETRCHALLEVTAEALDEDVVALLETDSFRYNPSFALSETSSIVSYKTERTINSRKSRYNVLPRRKYAGIGHSRLPQGLSSVDVDDASVLKVCRTIGRRDGYNYISVTFSDRVK
jgi:hypothetical protein